jgi:cephalosporin hydroxylase
MKEPARLVRFKWAPGFCCIPPAPPPGGAAGTVDLAARCCYKWVMLKTIKRGFQNFYRPWLLPSALRALQAQTKNLTAVESAVDLAFEFRHYGIQFAPSQVPEEITSFLKLLAQRPPATVLEVGTDKGGTFFLLTRVAAPDALLLSLDLPVGQRSAYPAWREPLYREFRRERQRVELVRRDSHDPRTVEKIQELLGGRKLDLLFIDGDHSYEGVKKDFEMYSPLVAGGGVMAFHDIVDGPKACVGDSPRFWRELKQNRRHLEFVKSWQQGGWGIGVLLPEAGA